MLYRKGRGGYAEDAKGTSLARSADNSLRRLGAYRELMIGRCAPVFLCVPCVSFASFALKSFLFYFLQRPRTARAVWLKRIRRSSSEGGAERRHSLPRSTPRCTAGRSLTAARQRATLGNSSSAWPSGFEISTHGQDAMSTIEYSPTMNSRSSSRRSRTP